MMCYIQLSLWNIPAEVIVGNSLTLEFREVFYTPSYYLFGWEMKLRFRSFLDLMRGLETTAVEEPEPKEPVTVVTSESKPPQGEAVAETKNKPKLSEMTNYQNAPTPIDQLTIAYSPPPNICNQFSICTIHGRGPKVSSHL